MYNAILPLYYCPPLSWFAAASQETGIAIEVMEPYRKQLYTNRMHIRVSNRVMTLSVPVARRNKHVPIKEKRISYQEAWQRQHMRSIQYAYQNSPFYEYYADHFQPFFDKRYEWLIDFNMDWLQTLLKLLKMEVALEATETYDRGGIYKRDYRPDFDPTRKHLPAWFVNKTYLQVFDGFESNLSVIDLLCNEGPESKLLLREMFRAIR